MWGVMADSLSAAYFDESCVDGSVPFPVVAGFWNPIELWGFCDQHLCRALEDKPSNMRAKKFVRGNPVRFAKIVSSFVLVPVFATIEHSAFKPYYTAGRNRKADILSDAYTVCSFAACEVLDATAQDKKWRKPVETIFDDGSAYKDQFERGYEEYYATKPDSHLSKTVAFRDDEQTTALLAADLYAWLLARKYNRVLTSEEGEALGLLQQYPPSFIELTANRIRELMERVKGGKLGNDANAKGQTASGDA